MGIALENFDAVGAWRTHDEGVPIDASGVLADGTKLDGVASLRGAMVRYSDQFVRVVTEKLLTYALGRGVEYQDMPTVRSIVRDVGPTNYRFSSLVLGIVKSDPFQMNMKTAELAATDGGALTGETSTMFITKKHISRRTVLRGAGAALALPFLDAMVPAATALAQTAANPKPRFVGLLRAARHGARILGPWHRGAGWTPSFRSTGSRSSRFGITR